MTMQLYTDTSFDISKVLTNRYSTSFSLGILAFPYKIRTAIYSIYGFVRLADEIVDTFHDQDKALLLKKFKKETKDAIKNGISTNPVLHSFQSTVHEYRIDKKYIDAFLKSMELDTHNNHYDRNMYDTYVYGSAEVVGLMCLKVFCGGDDALMNELTDPARSLGAAFQKVNFLRDVRSDLEERGRIYLPGISHVRSITDKEKRRLEEEIEKEFTLALSGIRKLPREVKLGVYTAYLYYFILFKKIKRTKVGDLLKKRVRVSDITKLVLLFRSALTVRFLR